MEADLAGKTFERLTKHASVYRAIYVEQWAREDGRFRPTPAAEGEPKLVHWEMIYWIGGYSADAQVAADLLDKLGVGYEVVYDPETTEFVVLTDYVVPSMAGVTDVPGH